MSKSFHRNRTAYVSFGLIFLSFCSFSSRQRASALPENSQAGRQESAEKIIRDAKSFKLNAAEFHAAVAAQNKNAKRLSSQASKLSSQTRKLNAAVEEKVRLGVPLKDLASQYRAHLSEFSSHAQLYNAHLAEYEKQVLKVQAATGQLQGTCKEYADHVQKFHIPGLRPPHVCVQMQWENQDMQKMAREFQEDQKRAQRIEAKLSKQEADLQAAARERSELERKLVQTAELDELERSQGLMLLKEYQAIEREFRMLQEERKRIEKR